ncbi:MAG TPA: GNAT family N-acetyltransferase [Dehalococcoidia bacterium]
MSQRSLQARDAVGAADGITVRLATVEDVPALVALINDAYRRSERGLFGQTRTSVEMVHAALDNTETSVFVAMTNGQLAGSVEMHLTRESAHYGTLATAIGMHGRGVASRLIAYVERRGSEAGHSEMRIECVREVGLKAYYEARGYELTHTVEEPLDSERSIAWQATRPWAMLHMRKLLR